VNSACTILDRESYSLVLRRKAHQYQEHPKPGTPRLEEPERVPDEASDSDVADHTLADPPASSGALQRGLPDEYVSPSLDPFQPFKYCFLHQSAHVYESVMAIIAAPVEYPGAFAVNTGALLFRRTLEELEGVLPRIVESTLPTCDDDVERLLRWKTTESGRKK
jgi:hypothetical protein